MASIRRSRRSSTQTKKYKEVDSDDENDKLAALLGDESGSDFEKDLKKKKSNGFLDPKISSSSSSEEISDENISEESADEEPVWLPEDSVKIKKKNSNVANRKKVTDGRKLMKQRETLLEEKVKNKMKANGLPVYFKKTIPKSNSMPTNKGLSLSESSSSEDENEKPSQTLTKVTAKKIKSPLKASSTIIQPNQNLSEDEEEEIVDFSAQLESIAKSQGIKSEDSDVSKTQKKEYRPLKNPTSISDDIASLLAKGEGVAMENLSNDDSEENSIENKTENPEPTDSMEPISIELPHNDNIFRKRKKKGFDVEAWVRRELGRAQRELQMLKHQTHVLCLIGHLKYLNSFASDHDSTELLLATAMSVIPPTYSVPAKDLDMVRLAAFVSWFKSAFQCLKDDDMEFKFPHPLEDWLMRALENYICVSPVQKVLLFLLLARSMGWPTRLVLNLDTISFKPEKSLGTADLSKILGESTSCNSKESSKNPENSDKKDSTSNDKTVEKSNTKRKESITSDDASPNKKSKKDSSRPSKNSKKPEEVEKSSKKGEPKNSSTKQKTSKSNPEIKIDQLDGNMSEENLDDFVDKSSKKSQKSSSNQHSKKVVVKPSSSSKESSKTDPKTSKKSSKSEIMDPKTSQKSSKSEKVDPKTSKNASKSEKVEQKISKRNSKSEKEDPRTSKKSAKSEKGDTKMSKTSTKSEKEDQKMSKKSSKSEKVDQNKSKSQLCINTKLWSKQPKDEKREKKVAKEEFDCSLPITEPKYNFDYKSKPSRRSSTKTSNYKEIDSDEEDSESELPEKSKKQKSTKLDLKKLQSPSSSNKKSPVKKSRLSDSALNEVEKRKKSSKRGTKSEYFTRTNSDSDSDFEMSKTVKRKIPSPDTKKTTKKNSDGKEKSKSKPKTKSTDIKKKGLPYWIEVNVGKSGWITVDAAQGRVNCALEMEDRSGIKPMLYVIAVNMDGTLKDVTKRYAGEHFDTQTRKSRTATESWFQETLGFFERKKKNSMDVAEEKYLESISSKAPMPTTVGAFKDHPLYALTRHLLKFEAIYPSEAPPLGFIRSEPIYARECVHTLHCRITWLKAGRVVRIGEDPYKVVKARPKWDRMSGQMLKDQPLEVFGKWQTELYIPPPAKDGKVPRNEYGNVELFKPWMLPKGTVHLPLQGLNRVAKKLNIDCAPCMIGWAFDGGRPHPEFDGFVVCEEFQDTLMDAWNNEQEDKERRDREKKTKRALDNWKKLIRGMMMYEKIKKKYANPK